MSAAPTGAAPRFRGGQVAPIPFRFKQAPEHFRVYELRGEPPAGHGEHLHVFIEKRNTTTQQAVRVLSKALGVSARQCGFCGQKDKLAVTRQWISLAGAKAERLERLHSEKVVVLESVYDTRKLRLGAHAGNRFELWLQDLPQERMADVQAVLQDVQARGLPNEFGPQRYGQQGLNAQLGRALQRGAGREFLALWGGAQHLGHYSLAETFADWVQTASPAAWEALQAGRAGLPEALQGRIRHSRAEQPEALLENIPKGDKRFFLSAMQSELFDDWVQVRRENGAFDGAPLPGDCLGQPGLRDQPIATGAEPGFPVGDAPLGPLFGPSMNQSQGAARALEGRVLQRAGLSEALFQTRGPEQVRGSRRALFAHVREVDLRPEEGGAWLAFDLPPGAYATTVLAQLSKDFALPEPAGDSGVPR